MSGQNTLYLNMKQKVQLHTPQLLLKDIADTWCSDKTMLAKCRSLKLYSFQEGQKERAYLSVVDIIQRIQENWDNVDVETIGELDAIAEYIPDSGNHMLSVAWQYVKIVVICLIIFCGSAFAIMTFNKDVDVDTILEELYTFVTGVEPERFNITQIGYSVGVPIGILAFYSHFLKKKRIADPTPLQVQIRQYEQDINTTLIENNERLHDGNN